MTLWQVPENNTDTIQYWRWDQLEDIDLAFQEIDAPYRWTEAVCSGLAAKLAVKKSPEKLQFLAPLADKAFLFANDDEREKAALRIIPG